MTDDSADDPDGDDAAEDAASAAADERRAWLVERDYGDEDLITLVYATPDGEWMQQRQRSTALLRKQPPTAAVDIAADELAPVADEETKERYAREAERLMERNEPDDEV